MTKYFLYFLLLLTIISCTKKEKQDDNVKTSKKTNKFDMYQISEMAALMEQMYVENEQLKKHIIKNEPIGKFPSYYLRIYTSKFTDISDNDAFFKKSANEFIEAEQLIYKDTTNLKENYNKGVDACLKCHEQKCGGPIPKIKKLYIR